jgi:hypothetical protein
MKIGACGLGLDADGLSPISVGVGRILKRISLIFALGDGKPLRIGQKEA